MNIIRTSAQDPIFKNLVKDLDKFLKVTDGDDHAFYDQYNQLNDIKYALIVYYDGHPIGCGAIKQYDEHSFEVKRMYIQESQRGSGYAGLMLKELESWAKELGATMCILETGIRQTAAIRLYQKNGYNSINNYGQYEGVEDSLCFQKEI